MEEKLVEKSSHGKKLRVNYYSHMDDTGKVNDVVSQCFIDHECHNRFSRDIVMEFFAGLVKSYTKSVSDIGPEIECPGRRHCILKYPYSGFEPASNPSERNVLTHEYPLKSIRKPIVKNNIRKYDGRMDDYI